MTVTATLPKPSRRASTLINLAFHYSAIVLVMVQGIVLVPLYLSRIPGALYGAWLATGQVLTWIELVDPGLSDMLRQRVAHHYGRDDAGALARSIGTGLALSVGLSVLPLTLWPAAGLLTHFDDITQGRDTLALAFRIGLLSTSCSLLSYGVAAVNLGLQLPLAAGLAYTAATVLGIGVTVAALLAGVGLPSLPLGMLVRAIVLFLGNAGAAFTWCRRHLPERPGFSRDEVRQILGLSVYTFVSRLGTTLVDRADALLAAKVLSTSATESLVLTGRALEPVRNAAVSIASALMPGLSHLTGEGDTRRVAEIATLVMRVTGWVTAVGVGSIVALNADFVGLWAERAAHRPIFGGAALTTALAAAVALSIFSAAISRLIYAVGGIRQSAGATLVEALIKLPLQIVLMRRFGLIGLPVAGIVATVTVSGWYLPRAAARLLQQPLSTQLRVWAENLLRLGAVIALGTACRLAIARFHLAGRWPSFIATSVAVGVFLALTTLAVDPRLRASLRALRQARKSS